MALSTWLDEFMRPFSEASGIPAGELSTMIFGEALGNVVEMVADWTTKGWLKRVVQGLVGLATFGYGIYGNTDPRTRREMIEWGTHSASRALIITPETLPELVSSAEQSVDAILNGDLDALLNSVVRSPDEIVNDIENITSNLGIQSVPPPPPPLPSLPAQPTQSEVRVRT